MVTHADVERDGPLHRLDDVTESHLAGRPAEHVTPPRSAARPHQPLVDELLDDLLEELPGNPLAGRDLGQRADSLAGILVGQMDDGPEGVVDLSAHLQKRHGNLLTPAGPRPRPSGCARACPRSTLLDRRQSPAARTPTGEGR